MNHRTVFASVLWSSCLAMLAVGANSTAIMAALPDMRTELSLSSAGVEWAVNDYLIVSAACIVLGGQAADRFGSRLASMVGLALFGHRGWRYQFFHPRKRGRVRALSTPAPFWAGASA